MCVCKVCSLQDVHPHILYDLSWLAGPMDEGLCDLDLGNFEFLEFMLYFVIE